MTFTNQAKVCVEEFVAEAFNALPLMRFSDSMEMYMNDPKSAPVLHSLLKEPKEIKEYELSNEEIVKFLE